MSENLGTIQYTVDANVDPLLSANKQGSSSLDGIEQGFNSASSSSKRFDTQITKTAKGVKTANSGLSSMRGQLQNTSYQLQDMVVQAQMGTNAFVIMGQQLPQLLGGFGAVGAGLGVFVALGAALGGVLQRTMSAGDAAKDYNEEIELLSQTVKVGENGIVSFSDKFGELAQSKPDVAMSKIRGELERVSSIMNIVSSDIGGMTDEFGATTYKIKSANKQLETWTGTAEGLERVINKKTFFGFVDAAGAARREIAGLQSVALSLNENLGITTSESIGLVKALNNIDTPDGVISAARYISDLSSRLNGASPEVDKLNVKFNEMRVRAENLKNSQIALNKALEDTGRVADSTERVVEKTAEANIRAAAAALSLADKIALQNVAMKEGEEAAVRLAAEQALGDDVSESLKQTVSDLAVEYYRLTESQKDAQAAAKEQAGIDRKAQSVADQARMQNMSEIDQIKAKAQAQRDLINSSKEMTAAQKAEAVKNIGDNEQSQLNQATFGTTDANQIMLQETLGITQELASQLDDLDQKFKNIGSTIGGTLYDATMSWSDAAGQTMAQNIADGESLDKGLKDVAATIATQLLGSLISLGIQYGINAALATAAGTSVAAASAAEAATLSAAWAPAAAGAAVATVGGAATAGSAGLATAYGTAQTLSVAGGRLNGGPVSAGSLYDVTEDGKPELLTVGGKSMLMMGNQSGNVTSNKDMMASGSGGLQVVNNVYNNSSNANVETTSRQQDGKLIIDTVVADINSKGKVFKSITNNTTANNKL